MVVLLLISASIMGALCTAAAAVWVLRYRQDRSKRAAKAIKALSWGVLALVYLVGAVDLGPSRLAFRSALFLVVVAELGYHALDVFQIVEHVQNGNGGETKTGDLDGSAG